MSAAEKINTDHRYVHQLLMAIYADRELRVDNILAGYVQAKPKDYDPNNYRIKNAATVSHASATRNTAEGAELIDEIDWARSAYRRVVNSLPDPYPSHIRGRFKPSPELSEKFLVIYPVLEPHKDKETITAARQMERKKDMLDHIYRPREVPDERYKDRDIKRKQTIWERYGYTSEEWMDCKERKTWDWVNQKLREHLQPATEAFVSACLARGLEI